jgi:hypothetical protein
MPPWWGRPNDNDALLEELKLTGAYAIATLYNAIGLVLVSADGHVDIELDDLIARIGMDPRSAPEREACRLRVWRILNLLSAVRVVGQRRMKIKDRVTRKTVEIESDDPLLTVSAWRPVGSQQSFDAGSVPLAATIAATPWLAKWRNDRRVLSDFGSLLRVTKIPIGKPGGAWARAIGSALQQLWREQATRITFARVGDGRGDETATSARGFQFTRRELLELFQPEPSAAEVLASAHPGRAVEYWEGAIAELRLQGVLGYCAPGKDWSVKGRRDAGLSRKNWSASWLDERLDIRPHQEGTDALQAIASSAKRHKSRPSR